MILASNALIFIVTIPIFFVDVTAFYFLCFTRLFIGVLAAVIINATVAYIGDAVPKDYQSVVGTVINTGIVMGVFVTAAFDLALPTDLAGKQQDDLWRFSYSIQLVNCILTSIMWLTLHKDEPLKYLITQAEKRDRSSWHYRMAIKNISRNYDCQDASQTDSLYKSFAKEVLEASKG